ncbi:MAG: hypothetical protein ACI4HL_02480 [Ruminococcus sp.]
MMILNSKISGLQFSVFVGLSTLAFVTIEGETVSCLSMIISIVIAFLLLIPTFFISSKEKLEIPPVFQVVIAIFVTAMSVYILNGFSDFFVKHINPNSPKFIISALFILALAYPATKGIEAISRSAIIAGAFVLVAIVLIIAFTPYSDMADFSDNEKSSQLAEITDFILMFSPLTLSFFFYRNYDTGKVKTVSLPFIIVSLVTGVVMCFVKLLNVSEYSHPFYTLSQVSFKVIPMGFSGLFIALSIICVFFALLYFTLTIKSIAKNNTRLMSTTFLVVVYCLSVITSYVKEIGDILLNRYFLLVLLLIVTLIVPIAVKVKENRND